MNVLSKTGYPTGRAQILREARIKARASARAKAKENTSSKTSSETALLSSKSGTTNKTQLSNSYSAIKTAADGLQAHASKLLATGEDSLFGKANQTTTNVASTEAQATASKDNVVKEITSFIQDYNTMVGKLRNVGGTANKQYLNQMKKNVSESQAALKVLGIKQSSNGTLSVNKKTLNSADIEKMKTVFGSKNSFAEKTSDVSQKVEAYADVKIVALKKCSDFSNYNQSGTSSSSYSSSGSLYNTLG